MLKSLKRHWEELTRFVDDPGIPLDNNAAERALRNPVVGCKNYYGAGNEWSGQLTVWRFSIFMTLHLWDINLHTWLIGYLQACTDNNRQPLDDFSEWLPWEMSEERLRVMRGHDSLKWVSFRISAVILGLKSSKDNNYIQYTFPLLHDGYPIHIYYLYHLPSVFLMLLPLLMPNLNTVRMPAIFLQSG